MKTLKEALLEHSPQMLRAIAEMNHIETTEASRDALAAHLAAELARPDVAQRAWQLLADAERGILNRMMLNGGKAKAFQMLRDHGEIRPFGPVALARDKPWLTPANATERLWYLGLIHHGYELSGEVRGEIFFIPAEILPHLPQPEPEPIVFPFKTVAAPESVIEHGDALMWDTFILMAFVARTEPPLAEGGLLNATDLRQISAELLAKDAFAGSDITNAPRLAFLNRLARTARLIRPIANVGMRLGPQARPWLRDTHQHRRLLLFEAWKRERLWNELRYVPSLKLEETGWRNDPRLARETILRYLAQCPSGVWLSLPAFVAGIKQLTPDFQRPDGDYDRWHMRDAETGKLLTGFAHWDEVEGALIEFMFTGPLLWLGLVSLDRANNPSASRITEFGARALELMPSDGPEPTPQRFVVQGDFMVLVPQEAPLYARFQLERMADRMQWDRVSTYRLTRESLARLLRHQVTIDQILAFLKRASREPFPKNVEFTLREWATKYGEITLRRAAILHTRDHHLLFELQHHPKVRPYIVELLSPTVALVNADQLEELQQLLLSLGYSPQMEDSS